MTLLVENNEHYGSLEQQITRYQQVLDILPAGVILLNVKGFVIEANPEATRLLGLELTGMKWNEVVGLTFAPQDDDGHEISLKSGKKVKLAISASTSGQLILITDMTETRLLQSRISQMQRMSSLGQMVASLAHQVRTPLSSAMLYASNLASPNLDLTAKNKFQTKLMQRLKDLEQQVSDMLLFAKGGDNKVLQQFSVGDLLDSIEPKIEALLMQSNVDFSIDSDCDDAFFLGNEDALSSAICNLIINAVQMSGEGCRVAVDCVRKDGVIELNVTDNGPGIAPELQQKILEPFYTTRKQGTGLGLAVVQMVCAAHKGKLQLRSQLGQGAQFILVLPYQDQTMLREGKNGTE